MILVLTGTHHQPFDRLVRAAEVLAADGERVVVQAGSSTLRPAACEVRGWYTPGELAHLADEAEVIVAHGGPGSLFLAWERGRIPVVVPRDPALGEHVDDHQLRFAATLGARAILCTEVSTIVEAARQARSVLEPGGGAADTADPGFVARFAAQIRRTVGGTVPAPAARRTAPRADDLPDAPAPQTPSNGDE